MKIDFCTIASANYLPRVRVLQESLKHHHPDCDFHILLCEHPDDVSALAESTQVAFIAPDAVCSDWQALAFQYEITEFNTALKPYLLEYLLANSRCEAVIYLDPDIEVFSSLQSVMSLFVNHDLILTPHVCLPLNMDGQRPGIDETIRAGIYNLGFIGISGSAEARAALRWWQGVCHDYCFFDASHRYFVDQFWAAAMPAFIQKFYSLRNPGCNVAYWNIYQRQLSKARNRWLVDQCDLLFFHFSGLPEDIRLVSRHQNRVRAEPGSDLHELLSAYKDKVARNSWSAFDLYAYSLERYSDGGRIDQYERMAFRSLTTDQRAIIGNPFGQPAKLRALGHELTLRTRLSPTQKYLRLLSNDGMISGHRKLLRHLLGVFRHSLNRTRNGK